MLLALAVLAGGSRDVLGIWIGLKVMHVTAKGEVLHTERILRLQYHSSTRWHADLHKPCSVRTGS